jgi:hypothetical protein
LVCVASEAKAGVGSVLIGAEHGRHSDLQHLKYTIVLIDAAARNENEFICKWGIGRELAGVMGRRSNKNVHHFAQLTGIISIMTD